MPHTELLAQNDIYALGREWLCECFPDDEDDILALSDDETQRAVNRYRDGGWTEFLTCHSL